jgi:hypothetical protein
MAYNNCINLIMGEKCAHAVTMDRVTKSLYTTHEILFQTLSKKITDNTTASLRAIVDEMMADGIITWGRVATAFAFVTYISRDASREDRLDRAKLVADKFSGWIDKHGGWAEFETFFKQEPSWEEKVWRGLWLTLAGLTVAAIVTVTR